MPELFKEILPSILVTKKSVIRDKIDEKSYLPWIVNRALAHHVDCVPFVNELNINHSMDRDMQYVFYMSAIRSMKRRYQPWKKAEKDENIKMLIKCFGYTYDKARIALTILSEAQLSEIKEKTNTGGRSPLPNK